MRWVGWSSAVTLALACAGCNGGYYDGRRGDDDDLIEPDPDEGGGAPGVPADDDGGASDADDGGGDDGADGGVKFDVDLTPAPSTPHELVVYRGDGDGGFSLAARYPIGDDVGALAALPMNDGDGDDLVVAGATGGLPELRRFTSPAAHGGFSDRATERFGALGVGDLDGDGDADVVLADARWVWPYFTEGSSLSTKTEDRRKLPDDQADARAVAVVDLAEDGVADVLVAAGWQSEPCGGRPLSLALIDDFTTDAHATTQTEYGGVPGGGRSAQIALADFDDDGQLDVLLAADAGDVLELSGAGSVFDKPTALDEAVERVALRPRPLHDAFDLARYVSPRLGVARLDASGLVDVAGTDALAPPAHLELFDARPSVAVLTETRDRVLVLDVEDDELQETASLVPTMVGDDVVVDVVVGDFDGDGFEDLGLDVASASSLPPSPECSSR